ncbi:MAG: hypothetical protein Q9226_001192 [Calogaya cf. arnoldii]
MTMKKAFTVVVTGVAPFKDNERNATQDVKAKIPDLIERKGKSPIKIINFPYNFRNVITDMDIIPTLWNQEMKVYDGDCNEGERIYVDAMLHMGITSGGDWQVEKVAHRDGYDWVGDDEKALPEHNGGKGERREGLPEILTPVYDVEKIVERIKKDLPDLPAKASTDAGLKYCEFILYTSLATLHKRGESKRALFFHHPMEKGTEEDIQNGAKVAVSVITSMIDQVGGM